MAARVFVGKLAPGTKEEELSDAFSKYGQIKRIDVKPGFAFVFYEEQHSVSEAVSGMHGRELNGSEIVVEVARNSNSSGGGNKQRNSDMRLTISNLDPHTSWQDLKDWARNAGSVSFTNVYKRDGETLGVVEYESQADVEEAFRVLETIPLHGANVRVSKEIPGTQYDNRDRDYSRQGGDFRRGGGGYGGRDDRYIDPRAGRGGYDDSRGGYPSRGYDRPDSRGYRGPSDDYRRPQASGGPPAHRSRSRERSRERGAPAYAYDRGDRGGDRFEGRGDRFDSRGGDYGGYGAGYGAPPAGRYDAPPARGGYDAPYAGREYDGRGTAPGYDRGTDRGLGRTYDRR